MTEANTSTELWDENINVHGDVSAQIHKNKVGFWEAIFAPLKHIHHFSNLIDDLHNTRAANDDQYNKAP